VNRKQKEQAIKSLDTQVIKNVLGSLSDQERSEDRSRYPLAGLVHLSGIGQVPVRVLRAELSSRGEKL
jgi:hypothetical protein